MTGPAGPATRTASRDEPGEPKRGVGVLPGGRLTLEDAYAYAKFARAALAPTTRHARAGRLRRGARLPGVPRRGPPPTTSPSARSSPPRRCSAWASSPRRRRRSSSCDCARPPARDLVHLGQWSTPAVVKTGGRLVRAVPGREAETLDALPEELATALTSPGAVVLVGERAAEVPGLYAAVDALATRTGARVAWIPRRAGERGALEVGAVPTVLPGGARSTTPTPARRWPRRGAGRDLPSAPGRDLTAILRAAADGELAGLVVGGLEITDLPDPALARAALDTADVVVSLEQRAPRSPSAPTWCCRSPRWSTSRAPSATGRAATGPSPPRSTLPAAPRAGRRYRGDHAARLPGARHPRRRDGRRPVHPDPGRAALGELNRVGVSGVPSLTSDARSGTPRLTGRRARPTPVARAGGRRVLLASWRQLIDGGALLADEPDLAGTARPPALRVAARDRRPARPGRGPRRDALRPARVAAPARRAGRPARGRGLGPGPHPDRPRCGHARRPRAGPRPPGVRHLRREPS